MFAEAFHSMIMGIQLALEVKTSIGSSTTATCSSTESSSQKPRVPINSIIGIAGNKRRKTCTQKVTKQSLRDYAQQD
jgi:hypothetical protein